jgi:hypothetical protein
MIRQVLLFFPLSSFLIILNFLRSFMVFAMIVVNFGELNADLPGHGFFI